jgi:hypothetical protein
MFLYGVSVWAVSATRMRQRCQGITSLDLFFAPTVLFSGAYGEVMEFCSRVRGQGFIVFVM